MKNTSPIPSRFQLRVKQRLQVLEYATLQGIHQASRSYGIERKTFAPGVIVISLRGPQA